MGQAFLNSLIITVPATILPILIGAGAAYAFAWLRFPLRNTLFLMLVPCRSYPCRCCSSRSCALHPVGIVGTYPALWIAHTAFGLPLTIYIMRNFMSGIPYDLLESGRIDGAGDVRHLHAHHPAADDAGHRRRRHLPVHVGLERSAGGAGLRRADTAPMTVIVRTLVGQFGRAGT